MKKLNVGIIGFGLSGRVFHAPLINSMETMEVSKIVTTNPENVRYAKKLYPDAVIVSKADELFGDDGIDLVVVASPNTYHVDFATKGLMANKHVVVEKPFTITSNEAEELIKLSYEKIGRASCRERV